MKIDKLFLLLLTFIFQSAYSQNYEWQQLPNSPVPDSSSQRFEDIHFINATTAYMPMYSGKVYKTSNGGNNWTTVHTASDYPFGKYRSIGFFNEQTGILGTLNSSFPLKRTTNGGVTWNNVVIPSPVPYGICGISIVNDSVAYGCGRYAAPANVVKTTNKGLTWTSITMNPALVRTLIDCYFWSEDSGIVVGGFNTFSYAVGYAVVMMTTNGGVNWQQTYISTRSGEWCWKISFPSKNVGYVSIERHSGMAYIIKTTNGGLSWNDKIFKTYDEEGIGFINENTGWIGGWTGPTYETTNGGNNWNQTNWGYYINRFRFINDTLAYAVGDRVYKYVRAPEILPVTKFAAIGDYGKSGANELLVSNFVKSWNPEFIITLGNNNYTAGSQTTIDTNIGQYYSQYIYPYSGAFVTGDTVNRFFPSLGENDWLTANAQPYLDYFTLPNNERYYDFIKGNIHFFAIDSDVNEADGRDSNSVQAQWLKIKLAESSEKWNIVYFNHPPYTSGSSSGPEVNMRWPFKRWGASAVISGHEHVYERLTIDGLPYFVNGLGGESIHSFGATAAGSQIRYNNNFGAMIISSYQDSLSLKFYNITGTKIDQFKILPSLKFLNLTAYVEGLYDVQSGNVTADLFKVKIRNAYSPYAIVDSAQSYLQIMGTGFFSFSKLSNATDYFLVVQQRNSLETWSGSPVRFSADALVYDFTDTSSKAFGNNLILKGLKYCIYSGDVDQNGVIDGPDLSTVDNGAAAYDSGYVQSDLNGDTIVDGVDLIIAENNTFQFVILIKP
ncbi:MAG: metallophosphoesterase [Ignavibacteria bacterium]